MFCAHLIAVGFRESCYTEETLACKPGTTPIGPKLVGIKENKTFCLNIVRSEFSQARRGHFCC